MAKIEFEIGVKKIQHSKDTVQIAFIYQVNSMIFMNDAKSNIFLGFFLFLMFPLGCKRRHV